MDGNGRWAAKKQLPRLHGHHAGAETLRDIVRACPDLDIRFLTVFAFSTENWRRTPEEVGGLMTLMRLYSESEVKQLRENGVQVRFIGDLTKLERGLAKKLENLAIKTKGGDRLQLTVAVNYGGRAEITHAFQRLASRIANGELTPEEVCESCLRDNLMTTHLPDPDLIVRTGGDIRVSNFLLWQSAYSELEFVDTLWPDFTPHQFQSIVNRYPERSRRFGANGD